MKPTVELILNFFEVSGCEHEYTAFFYIKNARSLEEAINNYFEAGCEQVREPRTFKSLFEDDVPKCASPPRPAKSGASTELRNAFNKTSTNGLIDDTNIEAFCNELGISDSGIEIYILGFLGNCKQFQRFTEANIAEAEKELTARPIKQQCLERFDALRGNKYYDFMKIAYRWLVDLLNNLNRGIPANQEKNTMLSFLQDVYATVLKENLKTPVFDLLINYITTTHPESLKRHSIQLDSFAYMPIFLETFRTVESLRLTQSQIDDMVSVPTLYSDFLEFINTPKKNA